VIPDNPISPSSNQIALFDLDNTLLGGDSDYLWGQFLVEKGIVERQWYESENSRFYEDYLRGTLNIAEFLKFALKPLSQHPVSRLYHWREQFVTEKIQPILLPAAKKLVESHRQNGDVLVIITATNAFVTEPIAELFGIPHLLATQPEFKQGRYTGRFTGIPCFQEGKIQRFRDWLQTSGLTIDKTWFYSDSHNDLPLLTQVTHPVAVDPDPHLEKAAKENHWPILSLRVAEEPVPLSPISVEG